MKNTRDIICVVFLPKSPGNIYKPKLIKDNWAVFFKSVNIMTNNAEELSLRN
jgi:hypothetical protein